MAETGAPVEGDAEQFVVPRRIKKAQVRKQLPGLTALQQPLQRQ